MLGAELFSRTIESAEVKISFIKKVASRMGYICAYGRRRLEMLEPEAKQLHARILQRKPMLMEVAPTSLPDVLIQVFLARHRNTVSRIFMVRQVLFDDGHR